MPKTQKEMLDQAAVRETLVVIRRFAKERSRYASTVVFENALVDDAAATKKLDDLRSEREKAIDAVNAKLRPEITALETEIRDRRELVHKEARDILFVAQAFFVTWLIQQVAMAKSIEGVFNPKRNLVKEYADAWINKGWRPPVK